MVGLLLRRVIKAKKQNKNFDGMKKKKKKRDEGQTKNEHIMASTAEEKETTEPREWGLFVYIMRTHRCEWTY